MCTRSAWLVVIIPLVLITTFCGGGDSKPPQPTPATLVSIAVSPSAASVAVGITQQFKATGSYSDGSSLDLTSSATWSASPAGLVTFASSGSAKGTAAGTVTIRAVYSGVTGATSLNVTPAALTSIAISPASSSIALGANQQFHATGTYSDSSTADVTALVTWTSSDNAIASAATQAGWEGIVTGRSGGTATITASAMGVSSHVPTTVTGVSSRFVYVANHDATISTFLTNSAGTLTASTYAMAGVVPNMIGSTAIAADKYLYSTDARANLVHTYVLNPSDGTMNESGTPLATGNWPSGVAVAANGKFLYVVNYLGVSISAYSIASDGSLTAVTSGPLQVAAAQIAADPAGKFLYVSDETNLRTYQIAADGQLTAVAAPISNGQGKSGIVVDPSGQFVFTADSGNTVSTFALSSSGKLTLVGTPATLDGVPLRIAIDPGGRFVYVTENLSPSVNAVVSFFVDSKSGALSKADEFLISGDPGGLTADPSGKVIYIPTTQNDVLTVNVDPTSGDFTLAQTMRGRGGPYSVSIAKGQHLQVTPKFVYGIGAGESAVRGYSLDVPSGALTQLAGSPFPATGGGSSVVLHPSGNYLYAANRWVNAITGYNVDSGGALSTFTGAPVSTTYGPYQLAVEPSGRFLYASDSYSSVLAFSVKASTGTLSTLSPVVTQPSPGGPGSIAIDPAGRVAYVANESGDSLSGFTIDAASGEWTQIGGDLPLVSPGNYPRALAFDPTGRYLFVAMQCATWATSCMTNAMLAYRVNADGSLTVLTPSPFFVGNSPVSVAFDATGRFVYSGSDGVYGYTFDASTGGLTAMASPFAPLGYAWLFTDLSGQFVLRGDDTGIVVYRVDPDTGGLVAASSASVPGGAGTSSCAIKYARQ